jgi:hypothetical protein
MLSRMSNPSLHPSMSPLLTTCLDPQPVPPSSHPLSPDLDDPSSAAPSTTTTTTTIHTSPHLHHLESWNPKRRPASIRSVQHDPPIPRRTHAPAQMRRSTSSQGTRLPNERNLIFDEWITSTAHPHLAAFSLIPSELVDDDKAVQDMLAEAMNEEHFGSMPRDAGGEDVAEEEGLMEEEEEEERPSTPMSVIDIPAMKKVEVETRPRSSSSLSLRKWAGIFVGRGERPPRLNTASHSQSPQPPLTTKRSFSVPDTATSTNSIETIKQGTFPFIVILTSRFRRDSSFKKDVSIVFQ